MHEAPAPRVFASTMRRRRDTVRLRMVTEGTALTLNDTETGSTPAPPIRKEHSLLDSVIEDLVLLRPRREHAVERKTIFLRTRAQLCGSHLDGLQILVEGDYDISTLPLLGGIRRSESESIIQF